MPPPGWTLASRIAIRVLPSLQHLVPSAALAHISGVSQGCPNLPCIAIFSTRLELRPLSYTGITRLLRYYGPFRHPTAPYQPIMVTGFAALSNTFIKLLLVFSLGHRDLFRQLLLSFLVVGAVGLVTMFLYYDLGSTV